ncbi:phage tail sheath C-terminal domain-containing protein [Flavobacterium sp. DGU11]|uniref:Phage tail sheath C-terminal domain-containing protein n=1 Tax=Flavobacterium arundinis TaxID=3139143 RepID=A0ABU9HRM9_9FLAO
MSSMKTPGVYVVERSAFPNSVVEVATAVPAFIGYTAKAMNGTKSLLGTPWRITSLAEFAQYFGEAPPVKFSFGRSDDSTSFISLNAAGLLDDVKLLASSMKVPVAAAVRAEQQEEAINADTNATPEQKASAKAKATETLSKAVTAIRAYVASVTNLSVQLKAAEAEADKIDEAVTEVTTKIANAAGKAIDIQVVTNALAGLIDGYDKATIKAKYYTIGRTDKFSLYHNMRLFFANGGGPCFVVSVGNYTDDLTGEKLQEGIETLLKEQEPTMVVIPEAVNLQSKADCFSIQQAMLKHCRLTMSRIAILDVYNGDKDRKDPEAGDVITDFRENIGTDGLDYAAAYYPFLNTSVMSENEISIANIREGLDDLKTVLMSYTPQLEKYINTIGTTTNLNDLDIAHKVLFKQSKLYATIMKEMLDQVNLLPPSAAMAGVYTLTDLTKEVWKAPANTGLANVISTTVNITFADQEDMNVPLDGKAVNAIRYFKGEGIKVWGARTLDGNSLDWKYVNVRRTMIMLEESIKNAAKAFVFDPNVANTWVIVRSTISNFLTGIWKRGGLPGAMPEEAFSVHVGLGDTMTPDEILEGIMRITVLVAISRPAEFIEITFMQQMQKS